MENKNILIVYNACGIKRDNSAWYIKCMQSMLDQDFNHDNFKILWSSCMNSIGCVKEVYSHFKDKISYCFHSEPHTVNITFNKAVRDMTQYYGQFDYYLYIDSGVTFEDQSDILKKIYDVCVGESPGMLTVQTDTDEAFNSLDEERFVYETPTPQIIGEHFVVPIGKACNAHAHVYSNEIFNTFNFKLIPDVFAAYCTESTFSFLTAAANQKWIIMKDEQVVHMKGVDGASAGSPHHSPIHRNPWNNLLFGRNALDFINNEQALKAGLGYEECNQIMMHNEKAYDEHDMPIHKEELVNAINKYFFLSNDELEYDKIKSKFIP
jgi:hypothetical protein